MMDVKDSYYLTAGGIMLLSFITGIVASHFSLKNKVDLVKLDLEANKKSHDKLESRLSEHENKIDQRLERLDAKVDGLKDLLIEIKSRQQ